MGARRIPKPKAAVKAAAKAALKRSALKQENKIAKGAVSRAGSSRRVRGRSVTPSNKRPLSKHTLSKYTVAKHKPAKNTASKHQAVDFTQYLPTVLSSLVAKLRANANAFFLDSYGVSLAEWRILSFLAEAGPSSAYDIWTTALLDKAVVSRETKILRRKQLVRIAQEAGSARRRTIITLTPAGRVLLSRSREEVLDRHDKLTAGLTKASISNFLRVAGHLESRIPSMSEDHDLPSSGHVPVKRYRSRKN
jgi:DNA-binding MarR family transcriptional regulator